MHFTLSFYAYFKNFRHCILPMINVHIQLYIFVVVVSNARWYYEEPLLNCDFLHGFLHFRLRNHAN